MEIQFLDALYRTFCFFHVYPRHHYRAPYFCLDFVGNVLSQILPDASHRDVRMIGDPGGDPDGARIHALDFSRHGVFLVAKGCVVCRVP